MIQHIKRGQRMKYLFKAQKNWIPCRMKAVFIAKVLGWICSPHTYLRYPRACIWIGLTKENFMNILFNLGFYSNLGTCWWSLNEKIKITQFRNLDINRSILNEFSKLFFCWVTNWSLYHMSNFGFPRHLGLLLIRPSVLISVFQKGRALLVLIFWVSKLKF